MMTDVRDEKPFLETAEKVDDDETRESRRHSSARQPVGRDHAAVEGAKGGGRRSANG